MERSLQEALPSALWVRSHLQGRWKEHLQASWWWLHQAYFSTIKLSSRIRLEIYLCRWASGRAVWRFTFSLPCLRNFSHDSHVSWTFRAEFKWYFSSLGACLEPIGADWICKCSPASLQEFHRGDYVGLCSLRQHQESASWLWEST